MPEHGGGAGSGGEDAPRAQQSDRTLDRGPDRALINVLARITRGARRLTLHLPEGWLSQAAWAGLNAVRAGECPEGC